MAMLFVLKECIKMTNKEVVAAMYKEFFNDHDVNAALKYVKEDYIQHNPGNSGPCRVNGRLCAKI
jgi:predicted SnoaL-like aldol condensation-catalyzing enzyme